ncbi:MAG: hypothetical protein HOW73_17360 [Polyangiaceae bacterium]|nr:hypothetical protein [Polyangiaceae bacterium]
MDFPVGCSDDWQRLDEIRRLVRDTLCAHPAELQNAAAMTASELVENAMKYGEPLPQRDGGRLTVSADDSTITITVENAAAAGERIATLERSIERIHAAKAPEELYLARLQEFGEDSEASGQLGLLRIAFEGRFDIRCAYSEPVLTMTAKRVIS